MAEKGSVLGFHGSPLRLRLLRTDDEAVADAVFLPDLAEEEVSITNPLPLPLPLPLIWWPLPLPLLY